MDALTFDTSAVIDVVRGDANPNTDLIDLIHAAMNGRVDLKITGVTPDELAADTNPVRREAGLARLKMYSVLEVPSYRERERDQVAGEMLRALFPNSQPGSTTYQHNYRDCLHLAAHRMGGRSTFVTLDGGLLRRRRVALDLFGVTVASPAEALAAVREIARVSGALPSLAVREFRPSDEVDVRRILEPLNDVYPDFSGWLTRTLQPSASTSISLGVVDGQVGAVAICKTKDSRVVKLAAFRVDDDVRGSGLGPHLLFQQIRGWVEAGFEMAYVTMSSDQEELGRLFQQAGFMVQGVTPHRYRRGDTELVLTKHLIRLRVEDAGFQSFADDVLGPLVVPPPPRDQGPWGDRQWWQPPGGAISRIEADASDCVVQLVTAQGELVRSYGASELEVLFHPLRLALAARRALLVPIQPHWADRLMKYSPLAGEHEQLELLGYSADKLLLRNDNAYYCFPKCLPDVERGAPILFYVSRPVMAVVGEARILQHKVDYPGVLHRLFGQLGIYTEDQIASHVQGGGPRDGMALALRFGLYVPFPRPVSATTMQAIMGHQPGFAPQGLHPITMNVFEALRTEGGLSW